MLGSGLRAAEAPQLAVFDRQAARKTALKARPSALLNFFGSKPNKQKPEPVLETPQAVRRLLRSVEETNRGLTTSKQQLDNIEAAIAELTELGSDAVTTDDSQLSATWKLLWTTEKETLFILERAGLFGTKAGDVYQVIDVEEAYLQNVITFPPEGAFIVDSNISIAGPQRTEFKFSSATLKLPKGRKLKLPPFGQGWFDTVYVDDRIRVAQDSRGDTLVVARAGRPKRFS